MTDIQIEISSGISASTSATLTLSGMESFVKTASILSGAPVTAPNVMTLEHNQAVLDGALDEFPDNPALYEWGVWSNVISGSDGSFAVKPSITANWGSTAQTSGGISLIPYDAGDDFVRRVSVTWQNQSGGTIASGEYDLDADGVIERSVSDFYRVNITFLSTNIPRRRVRLRRISYGILFMGRNNDISTCNSIEEAPESSDIAPSGALDFSIAVKSIRMRDVLRTVKNGALLPMKLSMNGVAFGSFFINQSEDVHGDGSKFNIHALSPLGAMDNTRFIGGMYVNKSVSQLITEIMQTAFTRGEISASIESGGLTTVSGYMPICACREAMQQVAFASGKSLTCLRDGTIRIAATRTTAPSINRTIALSEIFQGSKITQLPQYTAVEVTGYVYQLNEDRQIIVVYAVLSAGDYTYEFSEPLGNLYLTGASFVTYSANHAVIRVASSATVYLRGTTYIKTAQTYRVNGLLSSAARENICRFDSTLLYSPNVPSIALNLWSDASRAVVHDDPIALGDTKAGDYVVTERVGAGTGGLRVERLDIDMRAKRAVMRTFTGRIAGTLQPSPEIPQPPVTSTTFSATGTGNTGTIQTFTAPVSGTYTISAYGAQGGSVYASLGGTGGKGAFVQTQIRLDAGAVLDIIVGQRGSDGGYGGSGGLENGNRVGGGGGFTAAFLRTSSGRYTRLGVKFDCIVMAAGGGGAGTLEPLRGGMNGADGDASNIFSPSNQRYPSSAEYINPNDTTPSSRTGVGVGVHQYIDYAGAGARTAVFQRSQDGSVQTLSGGMTIGGFGGGGAPGVGQTGRLLEMRMIDMVIEFFMGGGSLTVAPGGGGWVHDSVSYPGYTASTPADSYGAYYTHKAFSWAFGSGTKGTTGSRTGNGQLLIEWTPG